VTARWLALPCAALLASGAAAQESTPDWDALRARPYPSWFRDAKLGVFIHWGVYSVPAYSDTEQYAEWFVRGLQVGDTLRTRVMREWYGDGATYYDLASQFHARLFDAKAWAELFRQAGAGYVVLVSKHHDGYALWPSRHAPGWNSVDVGPGRDIVGELTAAVRHAGLRMGLYYSLSEWTHPLHRWYEDPPESIDPYVEQHMIPQFTDLIATYRPVVLFTDGEWLNSAAQWRARELISWFYDTVGPDAIVNDRWGAGSDIGFLTPEYSAGIEETERPWAEVRGLGRSFGLNRRETIDAYMRPDALVRFFVGAVAAGGGMILNVGPDADGQIPLLQQERLLQLGAWLDVNGEAIYGSRPWTRTGEWREVTLTRIDSTVAFDWVRNAPAPPIAEDHFTAAWTGVLTADASGPHAFDIEADDEARMWIADTLVVDTKRQDAGTGNSIYLEAGRGVPVRIEFRETTHQAVVRVLWTTPRGRQEIIPPRALTTRDGSAGLDAVYRSPYRHVAYTTRDGHLYAVTFEWPDRELALPIAAPQDGSVITMLGRDTPLPWRYAHDTLYVDLADIPFREIPSYLAWTLRLEHYVAEH
jgi:alpha-L-fucosidase